MKNILIAIDFSSISKELIQTGTEIAFAFNGRIRLIHIAAPDPSFVGYEAGPQTLRDSRAETLREERKKMQEMTDRLTSEGITADFHMVQGLTAATLLEKAAEWEADVIIIGNRRRGLLRKVVLGSVEDEILKNARIPVIVVPANGEKDE